MTSKRFTEPMHNLGAPDSTPEIALDRIEKLRKAEAAREWKKERDELYADLQICEEALALTNVGAEYAHRLAIMLECALLDRQGSWDDGHALLAEYRAACERASPSPPMFMGEPVILDAEKCPFCGLRVESPCEQPPPTLCSAANSALLAAAPLPSPPTNGEGT